MSKIYNSILETIGNTPIVRLNEISNSLPGNIFAKLEFFNPASSVKDRIAKAIVETAENSGQLKPGGTIIEATSGNTGIGLSMVGAIKGYKVIIVMPETMSMERRLLMRFFGAKLVLTDAKLGIKGAVSEAEKIHSNTENSIVAHQFENEANPKVHRETTGLEILDSMRNEIDYFVSGVGTGGTLMGVGKVLKEKIENIRLIAVEPAESYLLRENKPAPHKIQGIGTNFLPEIVNVNFFDEIIGISFEDSVETSKKLASKEGILAGISSGAALAAAIKVANREEAKDKNIVVVLPDSAERYLSTGLFENYKD